MDHGTAYVYRVKLGYGRRCFVAVTEDGTEIFRTPGIHDVSVRMVRRKLRWGMGGTFRDLEDGELVADAIQQDTHTRRLAGIKDEIRAGTFETPERIRGTVDALMDELWDRR